MQPPEHSEDILQNLRGRIALIGNATPKRELGRLIDAYDVVIRMNNFRLAGFEKLIGTKTDLRCTTGWRDIECRNEHVEFSPFTLNAPESANLKNFNQSNHRPVLVARTDVHPFIPETSKPSAGFALVELMNQLGIAVDLFGFDGFKTSHYWKPDTEIHTTHSRNEIEFILKRPNVILFQETYPYEALYNFCHKEHSEYDSNVGLKLLRWLGKEIKGKSVLEFGAGNGDLAVHLEKCGNQVTAVEVSREAFERIPCERKIHGDAISLALLQENFDLFASVDVLEHLTENDIRLVIRESARLAQEVFVSVSTRPSGLLGPNGENLHLTVRPSEWWKEQFSRYFDVQISPGYGNGQIVLSGRRKGVLPAIVQRREQREFHNSPATFESSPSEFHIKAGYQPRLEPEYFTDSVTEQTGCVWQPDVYRIAANLGRRLGCGHVLDVGCGRAQKLVECHPEFLVTGMDYGENIRFCREHYNFGQWIETDFEKEFHSDVPKTILARSVVVCSDVIEHLTDPTSLLRSLKNLLNTVPILVLSTPERVLVRGAEHNGPPPNKAHVREWSLGELRSLLSEHGFCVNFIGLTRSNTRTNETKTILAALTGSPVAGLLEQGISGKAVLLDGDKFRFAEPILRPAASLDSKESPETLLRRGQELLNSGNVSAALRDLEQAADILSDDADLMTCIGNLHADIGNTEAARSYYSRALVIDPLRQELSERLIELTVGQENFSPDLEAESADKDRQNNLLASVVGPNQIAFSHLQRSFDLLKESRFHEAQQECELYQKQIDYDALPRTDNRGESAPKISVVIVAYKIGQGLVECLNSIASSENPLHEIIVVDNGGNESIASELARRSLLHIQVGMNVILAEGRNIGVHFARAPIIAFIDDDAIAAKGYLASVLEAFDTFEIHALRGKVLPKSGHPHNSRARHYNMGDLPFPADIDTEGNSAFLTETWRRLGGQDPLLFGGEGVELSYRIAREYGDLSTIYWPFTVIYHDYAVTDTKLETKQSRHALMRKYSVFKHPNIYNFHNRLVAFARSNETRIEGNRLLRRRATRPNEKANGATQNLVRNEPFISICIPTYNRAGFLEAAVRSALEQTYPNFEIVVVDDGSTDATPEIMRRLACKKIRYIIKEHSGGPQTRNRCIAEARGEFIVWLDSDDLILPGTLARYAAELELYPEVDVLYGDLQVANEKLVPEGLWVYRDYHGWRECLLSDTVLENRIPNVCTLVRKSCYDAVGGYDPSFPRAHDYEFWTRLAPVGNFKRVNETVGIYRRHDQSLSKVSKKPDTSFEARAVKAMIERHGLRSLFPFAYGASTTNAVGDAYAWMIASLLMLKYGDIKTACDFAARSVASTSLRDNETLQSLLDQTVNGRSIARKQSSPAESEFDQQIETAMLAYRKGQSGICAKACAQLSELAPEALETLLLVGLSLLRWGDARAGQTAFRCLVQRCCERAFLQTSNSSSSADPSNGQSDAGQIARLLSKLTGENSFPVFAVEQTLAFIGEVASATDIQKFLSTHRNGQTPIFFAILGLTEDELARCVKEPLLEQIRKVRNAFQPAPSMNGAHESGYSFCIITNGKRQAKLLRQIESIRALRLPQFEILVGGEVSGAPEGVRRIDLSPEAKNGRLGKMRNVLARNARFDHLVISDDDIIFDPDFAAGLKRFGEGYDAMGVGIENPDGSRFWDWATTGGTKGAAILPFWESDPDVYLTGGFCVLKADVLSRVQWDEARGFYEGEDVDFSKRLRNAGIDIRFNLFCKVVHDDDRYTRVENRVMIFDHVLVAIEQSARSNRLGEAPHLIEAAERLAAQYPDRLAALNAAFARCDVKLSGIAKPKKTESVEDSTGTPSTAVSVAWAGTFLDHGSLSGVNRALVAALRLQSGIRVDCVQSAPIQAVPENLRSFQKEISRTVSNEATVTVRHAWPPDWSRPKNGKLVVIQPWEFGSLPSQWVEQAKHVDEFWVPSNYVRDVYVNSGVEAKKVFVVPNGVDPEKFHPQAPPNKLATSKKFKFLFVGGTIFRKGPDLLLKAYLQNFTASDDVCLVIKDFGGQSVYAGQTIEAQIRAAQSNPNAPEILYLNEELPPDSLPGLFTACDCFVLPYRGEGFGLPALEAMACGLPLIVTAGGATDDFVRDELAFRIPAKRMIFGNEISGMKLVKPGWLLEPDVAELGRKMRAIFCNPTEATARGRRASEFARQNFSWKKSADMAVARVRAIAAQPPADRSRRREEADNIPIHRNPPPHVGGYMRARPIELPTCAKLGHLAEARESLKGKQHRAAWENTIAAINVRPFHPEAFLFLAEIALAAGDSVFARRCAQHAHHLVPNWTPAKKFLKGNRRGNAKHDWLVLPKQIANQKAETQNRLSVCLITKNEERFLGQSLKSIRDIAQQMVVVDTGSTDRTVEIAKESGAEVFHFTWNDDFSAARNAALEHVTGDWVLVLDADEELLPEHHATILKEMQAAPVMAYRLPIIDKGKENEGRSYVPRLFRNAPGLFFVGRVHEQVFSSIEVRCEEWGLKNQMGKSALLHHGYTEEIVASRDKIARNLRLLERAVEELPGEPNLLMSLGLELVRSKQLEAGLERYWEALYVLEKKPAKQVVPELRETLLTQLSTHLMAAKRFDEIERLWQRPFAKSNMTASQHFLLGLAQMELKRPAEASEQMRLCLSKRHLPALSPIHPEILRAGPNHCLALSLIVLKRNDEAEKAFRAALVDDSQSRSVKFDFARFFVEQSNPLEALKFLHGLVAENPGDLEAWQFGGQIALGQTDFLEFARDWTGEAIKHFPEHLTLIAQRAEALLLSGDVQSALPFWRQLQSTRSAKDLSALTLCAFLAGEEPQRFSVADENSVSREFLLWYRKLIAANASQIVCALNERMLSLRSIVPSFVQIWSNAAKEAEQVCD